MIPTNQHIIYKLLVSSVYHIKVLTISQQVALDRNTIYTL